MMQMNDYTVDVLAGRCETYNTCTDDSVLPETSITIDMLRKRPDIRSAICGPLEEFIIPWTNEEQEEPDDYIDNQLIALLKLHPFIETTIMECLLELTDCIDAEGEEMYRPSLFDVDNIDDIHKHTIHGGFREDRDHIPAKYDHLSSGYLDLIYSHPETRTILSKLPSEAITPELIDQLCS
jgi:hypothetical protein